MLQGLLDIERSMQLSLSIIKQILLWHARKGLSQAACAPIVGQLPWGVALFTVSWTILLFESLKDP